MSGSNKLRINSQKHANSRQKASRRKQSVSSGIHKVSSLQTDCPSPFRLTQKYGNSPYRKPIPLLKANESDLISDQKSPVLEEGKLLLLQKKISEHKLRQLPPAYQKIERSNPYLFSSQSNIEDTIPRLKVQPSRKSKPKRHVWHFTKGNNHQLLRQVFVDQYHLAQTAVRQNATVCWLQAITQKEMFFGSFKSMHEDHLPEIGKNNRLQHAPTIYNYLEGQSELTNKQKLYKNMRKQYPQSIGSYIPKSFIIDFRQDQPQVEESLLEFMRYYFLKDHNKKVRRKNLVVKNYFVDITITQKTLNQMIQKASGGQNSKGEGEEKAEVEQIQGALWLLKPTTLNRGRGIHIFSTLKQLSKLLSETAFEISIKMYNDAFKPKAYIIQQYIQRPLLIEGYKFDMRFWVLLQVVKSNGKKQLKTYLFEHGYSRLASIKFEGQSSDKIEERSDSKGKKDKKAYVNNKFIHLTNNAVQKDAKEYGQYCQGNQLSLQDTVNYIRTKDPASSLTLNSLIDTVKYIVTGSVNTVRDKLVTSNNSKTFQLLGYDFLLDQSYNIWLIEVNCNPCLQQSSALVSTLLRKMLGGLIHLTNLQEGKGPGNSEGWSPLL